jgi:hypothetical protein
LNIRSDSTLLEGSDPARTRRTKPRKRSQWRWVVAVSLVLLAIVGICIRIVIKRAEPILRTRVIETLSARFKSRVDLSELHVWIDHGLNVHGKGLKIYGATDPNPWQAGVQPLLQITDFQFTTSVQSLFREPMRVDTVYVSGLTMNIPPKSGRQQFANLRHRGEKMSIAVTHFICSNTIIVINTDRPGKAPLQFDIGRLRMQDIGPGRPLQFQATLINPKPVGNIQSTGLFGPLDESSPRDSVVTGYYSFTNADLSTLKGIAGTLSSTGQYAGTLGRIQVSGETDTPDFRLAVVGHPVPLHTQFHAVVDGTDGDTYLEPVEARILNSSLTARGKVVRLNQLHGHEIELVVTSGTATIQDLLRVAVRTEPPVMDGIVHMNTAFTLRPGPEDLADRIVLSGTFEVPDAHFSNAKLQAKINALSLRGLGKPQLLHEAAEIAATSDVRASFNLRHGVLSFARLRFEIPGTKADMEGKYTLDGKTFDFHGLLRTDAKLSQMTTGWKSLLLKPVDPFFHKHGAGAEIPFKLTGTKAEPHFGLDFHGSHMQEPASHANRADRAER